MKTTVGSADKVARIVLGLILLIAAFAVSVGTTVKAILILIGIIALLTGATGICPLYTLLGISTCKAKDS